MSKLFLTALSIGDALSATDAANALVRAVRQADRSRSSSDIVSVPLVDGCSGTLEFLVGHTLGSYLEVEATDAAGDQAIVPFGLCGADEKLAVIEMQSIAAVDAPGQSGTTAGVGELIRDAVDEGAFSILLTQEEPLARDAGLGLAAALGVKFYDESDRLLDFTRPGADLSAVARIDASERTFDALSARFFVARAQPQTLLSASDVAFKQQLRHLATVVRRDIGIELPVDTLSLSASGIEFGLIAFLSAAIREGGPLVLEGAQIIEAIAGPDVEGVVVLVRDEVQIAFSSALTALLKAAESAHVPVCFAFANPLSADARRSFESKDGERIVYSLQEVSLFQAPLSAASNSNDIRRDLLMRLDKLVPQMLAQFTADPAERTFS
jgi:glycerate kinase